MNRPPGHCVAALLLAVAALGHARAADEAGRIDDERSPSARLETVEVTGKAVRDPAWTSYRQTYKAMQLFGDAKDAARLKPRLQLVPQVSSPPKTTDLRLTISSAEVDITLPLDHGWATLPTNQAALDSDAAFLLNAPAGTFQLSRWMAIRRNPEGQYSTEALRTGCDAWLNAMRSLNWVMQLRLARTQCIGVRWVLPADDFAEIRSADGRQLALSPMPPAAPKREFGVLAYRFSPGEDPVIRAPSTLIAILPLLD